MWVQQDGCHTGLLGPLASVWEVGWVGRKGGRSGFSSAAPAGSQMHMGKVYTKGLASES